MLVERSEDRGDVRPADSRLLLPVIPERIAVLGDLEQWRGAIAGLGASLVAVEDGPELVVAPAHLASDAVAVGADHVILKGGGARQARRAGYGVRRFLPLPGPDRPELIVPLDRPRVARYAQRTRTGPSEGWSRARATAAQAALSTGVAPPGRPTIVVASRSSAPPFALRAAAALGVDAGADWFLWLGRGDALQRAVFYLFRPLDRVPRWVVKVGRLPEAEVAFARDEAAIRALPGAAAVTAHAPVLLGVTATSGLPVSAETAAVGSKLSDVVSEADRRTGLGMVDRITDWLYDLGRASRSTPDQMAAELHRLGQEVLPLWDDVVAPNEGLALLDAARPAPAVMQHNDVGCWNIVADPPGFTVVDWESANPLGLPLWDLVYFLVDAFAEIDRVRPEERVDHAIRLLSGRSQWSPRLFGALRRFVSGLDVPGTSVGAIVTLCWLHHGSSALRRTRRLQIVGARDDPKPMMESLARRWLADPKLGAGWDAWTS